MAEQVADGPGLPPAARRLVGATAVAAIASTAAALAVGGVPRPLPVVLLATGIAVGELLRVDLPHRGGGTASFGLGDAALATGLLLWSPGEVVLGAIAGMVALQVVERVPPVKFAVNLAQYALGAAAAAIAVHALVPRPGAVGPTEAGVVAIGVALFLGVNATIVSGMISLTGGPSLAAVLRALLPTGAVLALGNLALAVMAVALTDSTPWALPGLVVPVALLWYASRQAVRARLNDDRSEAFVEAEHRLGAATTTQEVADALAAAASSVLGCQGAVWLHDRWITPVPDGSGRCPVDASLSTVLSAPAPTLGVAVEEPAMAIGLGDGLVLLVTTGELAVDADATEWVERLGRSGRVHVTRVAAAQALHQERATLAAVVHGTGDGVLLLGAEGEVAIWNPAMARLAGVPAAEAVGQPVATVLGEGPWRVDGVHDVERPHAEAVWRVSVAGVHDTTLTGAGRMSVVAVHDVTAERRAARARDDMLGIVSHELRTPLTPILASAQMLRRHRERLEPAQREALLAQVQIHAEHLTRLVDDLLLVGQLSGGGDVGLHLARVRLEVGDIVAAAVETAQLVRPEHDLRLHVDEGCVATTDPVRLRQIVDNLLDNAGKFSPPGSLIEVGVAAEGGPEGPIAIRVTDRGRGIPRGELERVFERFTRVEDPLVMTTSGAGLGLYIVRHLVHLLGGTVDIDSDVGAGTTVTVRLPRLERLADDVPPPSGRAAEVNAIMRP